MRRALSLALMLSLCLPARAVDLRLEEPPPTPKPAPQEVELKAQGDHQALKLPPGVTQVGLVKDSGGHCRAGRTWGFDAEAHELWVSGRCSGRFRLLSEAPSTDGGGAAKDAEKAAEKDAASDRNKKIAIGAAAAAVLVGAVLLGRKDRHDGAPGASPSAPNPAADPLPDARPLQAVEGQLCLDLRGGAQQGAEAMLARCSAQASQRFWLSPQGELRVGGQGLCLDVAGGQRADGARVVAWPCNGQGNQRWRRHGQELRSQHADKCLDVKAGRLRDGEQVLLWSCNGGKNQRWW